MTTNNNNTELTVEQQKAVINTKEVLASKQDVLIEIGKLQAFDFMTKLTTVGSLKSLAKIKESKSYVGLTYKSSEDEVTTVGTWAECCQHILGSSKSAIDEKLINLTSFGEDFFESSQKIGLGVRDLRKLRQLPEEDQTLIIESEAIDSGDKEAVKELIEDLTAKHAKEKQALEAKATEATRLANVRDKLVQGATAEAQAAKVQLAEALEAQQHSPTKWLKQVQQINLASSRLLANTLEAISQLHDISETIITEQINDENSDVSIEMMASVQLFHSEEIFMAASNLSYETRDRFSAYITKSRPIHTEEEILALEQELLERV